MAPQFIIRNITGYGSIAVCSVIIFFLSLSHKKHEPYTGWKLAVVSYSCRITARIVLFTMSMFYIEEKRVKLDYSKWLGPDWECSFDKPGTVISNH